MFHPFGLVLTALVAVSPAAAQMPRPTPVSPVEHRLMIAVDQILAATARRDTPPPRREEPRRDEPKRDEPRREEPRRDEPKRDEPKRDEPKRDEPRRRDDEPKPRASPAPRSLGEPQLRRRRPE
jgi:hypothetical protein